MCFLFAFDPGRIEPMRVDIGIYGKLHMNKMEAEYSARMFFYVCVFVGRGYNQNMSSSDTANGYGE